MATRRLIALALACGLAILLAGGVQLVLLSRHGAVRAEDALLRPGTVVRVDDALVRADGLAVDAAMSVLTAVVEPQVTGKAVSAQAWSLVADGVPVERTGGSCGLIGGPKSAIRCTIQFQPVAGTVVAIYRSGGQQASWSL